MSTPRDRGDTPTHVGEYRHPDTRRVSPTCERLEDVRDNLVSEVGSVTHLRTESAFVRPHSQLFGERVLDDGASNGVVSPLSQARDDVDRYVETAAEGVWRTADLLHEKRHRHSRHDLHLSRSVVSGAQPGRALWTGTPSSVVLFRGSRSLPIHR